MTVELEQVRNEFAQLKAEAKAKSEESKSKPIQPATPKSGQPAKAKPKSVNPIPNAQRAACSLEEAKIGGTISQLIKFFLDEAEKWNKSQISRKITKIMRTKGEKQYTICLKSYRELLKCSLQGNCTGEQSAKWKKLYKECGDLVQKLEKQPKALKLFHVEVKQRRRKGELYSDAMARVAREIKAR